MLYVIGWRAVDLHETCIFVMWVYFSSERFSSAENKRKMKGQKKNNLISLRLSQVPKPLCMYFCFPLCLLKLLWCLRSTPLSRCLPPFTRWSNTPVNTQIRPNGICLTYTNQTSQKCPSPYRSPPLSLSHIVPHPRISVVMCLFFFHLSQKVHIHGDVVWLCLWPSVTDGSQPLRDE